MSIESNYTIVSKNPQVIEHVLNELELCSSEDRFEILNGLVKMMEQDIQPVIDSMNSQLEMYFNGRSFYGTKDMFELLNVIIRLKENDNMPLIQMIQKKMYQAMSAGMKPMETTFYSSTEDDVENDKMDKIKDTGDEKETKKDLENRPTTPESTKKRVCPDAPRRKNKKTKTVTFASEFGRKLFEDKSPVMYTAQYNSTNTATVAPFKLQFPSPNHRFIPIHNPSHK